MPEDYQVKVLAAYKEKKAKGELSLLLANATTAKLRDACLKNYNERCKPEDDDVFSEFFNLDKLNTDFRQRIRKADEGEFKPLLNHIKGKTGSTDYKNSELLAWLIDFQPRPSTAYYKSFQPVQEEEVLQPSDDDNPAPDEDLHDREEEDKQDTDLPQPENPDKESDEDAPPTPTPTPPIPPPPTNERLNKKIATALLILLISGGSITLFSNDIIGTSYREPLPSEKCMVWKNDRYTPIACDINISDGIILPLDKEQLAHQRKITQPDTLTTNSLGKVWYTKINGTPEFYTDSGMHPADTLRRLKPLTNYILTKYISYYRYLFKLLVWSISIIIFFILCVVCIKTIRKDRKTV